ncbi:MAG TPA: FixG Ig-like domain-containing protein, partial [Gemmatimonadaceae bacterium]
RAALAGARVKRLRPRVVLYPAALTLTLGGFVFALSTKAPAEVTLLRGMGEPYTIEADGRVANQLRVKIANRSNADHKYTIEVQPVAGANVVVPLNPLPVATGRTETSPLFILLPPDAFHDGERRVALMISDGAGYRETLTYRLVGPEREERRDHDGGHR